MKKKLTAQVISVRTNLVVFGEKDFTDINRISPVSNHSEVERLRLLNESVEEAKAALDNFSYPKESILYRFKKFFYSPRH